MKTYQGHRTRTGCDVYVLERGTTTELSPRFDLRTHSPDGFEWGYLGSGPSQLALALVASATGDDKLAIRFYQQFKCDHIASLDGDWTMAEEDIRNIVAGYVCREANLSA